MVRTKLSDLFDDDDRSEILRNWEETEAAEDYKPLPAGEYVAEITSGELIRSRSNQYPGYKLTYRIIEGEHKGRLLWSDHWFTERAMGMTKRDLAKIGIHNPAQLDEPLPQGIRVKAKVVIHTENNGTEYNRIKSFEYIGTFPPKPDPFAPSDDKGDKADLPDKSGGEQ